MQIMCLFWGINTIILLKCEWASCEQLHVNRANIRYNVKVLFCNRPRVYIDIVYILYQYGLCHYIQ